MKLILREYLRGLKERDELDLLLPNLLSESGMTIISRPAVGVRQYGVDLAAIGIDKDGLEKIFLISIKAGDIDRGSWDIGEQALRPSINEIIDNYIPHRIKDEHKHLPIVIAICSGGDVHQGVEAEVTGFINRNSNEKTQIQTWTGDVIVDRFLTHVISEQMLSPEEQSLFRKSIAMIDEPDSSFSYFSRFLHLIFKRKFRSHKERLSAILQVQICLWVLFVWAREADNIEAPYKSSELTALIVWHVCSPFLEKRKSTAKKYSQSMENILRIHIEIVLLFSRSKIIPGTSIKHGLSDAVQSQEPVDINLKLFDILSRLAVSGFWLHIIRDNYISNGQKQDPLAGEIQLVVQALAALINNNPILKTPLRDDHAIDISIACFLFAREHQWSFISKWITEITGASIFATRANEKYPCTLKEYRELLDHPKSDEGGYLERVTGGSILYPTLAVWAWLLRDDNVVSSIEQFRESTLSHCTMQLWFVGDDTEDHLYSNDSLHGFVQTDLDFKDNGNGLIAAIQQEIDQNTAFGELSTVKFSQLPLIFTACRHHRIPVPPNFWCFDGDRIEKIASTAP